MIVSQSNPFTDLLNPKQQGHQRDRELATPLGLGTVTAPTVTRAAPAVKLAGAEKHMQPASFRSAGGVTGTFGPGVYYESS